MNHNKKLLRKMKQGSHPIVFVNACTHGDERVGARILQAIENIAIQQGTLITNIANKEAFSLNKRCIDQDLNRVFPGKQNGDREERLAYELLPLIQAADVVIDIHSTKSGRPSSLIITKIDEPTRDVIHFVNPKRVLLLSATENNALISSAKIGIGFEYGKDNDETTYQDTLRGVMNILIGLGMTKGYLKSNMVKSEFYNVSEIFAKNKGFVLENNIKNFKLIHKGTVVARNGQETIEAPRDFYPILFGKNTYENIFGFMGEKMDIDAFTSVAYGLGLSAL